MSKTNSSDEWLIPFLPKGRTAWCPFDLETSAFVQVLRANSFDVVATHIDNGQDFFTYEPSHYDFICSNPPYTKRNMVFKRCFSLGVPFALLVNFTGIFDSKERYKLFRDNGIELLVPKGRISFVNAVTGKTGSPAFQAVYLCHNLLPNGIIFPAEV